MQCKELVHYWTNFLLKRFLFLKIKKLTFNAVNLTKFLKGSAILLLFSSFVISCHDNDVIEKEEDNQDPDTEESINLALGKTVETRINSITGL